MATAAISPKQQAHELIDSMAPGQIDAVISMLRIVADPLARSLANAPYEDELISDEENRSAAASKAWLAEHPASRCGPTGDRRDAAMTG